MKKRILSILLIMCMVIPCMTIFEFPVGAVAENSKNSAGTGSILGRYPFYVGSEEVTEYHLSGSGWSFDPSTDTLTLSNFSRSGIFGAHLTKGAQDMRPGHNGDDLDLGAFISVESHIYDSCTLNIVLADGTYNELGDLSYCNENAVKYYIDSFRKEEREAYFGIYAPGANIHISGGGELSIATHLDGIIAAQVTFDTASTSLVEIKSYACSLYVTKNLVFKGNSSVRTSSYLSNDAVVDSKSDIRCYGDIVVSDNAYVSSTKSRNNYKMHKSDEYDNNTIQAKSILVEGGTLSAVFYDDDKGETNEGISNDAIQVSFDLEICGGGKVTALVNCSDGKKKRTSAYAVKSNNYTDSINFTGSGVLFCGVRAVKEDAGNRLFTGVTYPKGADVDKKKFAAYEDYKQYAEYYVTEPQGIYFRRSKTKLQYSYFSDFRNVREVKTGLKNLSEISESAAGIIADNAELPVYITSDTGTVYLDLGLLYEISGITLDLKDKIYIDEGSELRVNGNGIITGLDVSGEGKLTFNGGTVQGVVDGDIDLIINGGNIDVNYLRDKYGLLKPAHNSSGQEVQQFGYTFNNQRTYKRIDAVNLTSGTDYGSLGIYPFEGERISVWHANDDKIKTASGTRQSDNASGEVKDITVTLYSMHSVSRVLSEQDDLKLWPVYFQIVKPGEDALLLLFYEYRSADINPYILKWSRSEDGISWTDIENSKMDGHGNLALENVTDDDNGDIYRCKIYDAETGELIRTHSVTVYVYDASLEGPEDGCPEGKETTIRLVPKFTLPEGFILYTDWFVSKDGGKRYTRIEGTEDKDSYSFDVTEDMEGWIFKCHTSGSGGYGNNVGNYDRYYTVKVSEKKVYITEQPKNRQWVNIEISEEASISVKAENATNYQWQVSKRRYVDNDAPFEDIPGATSATYSIMSDSFTSENMNYVYRCVVSNQYSEVISDEVYFKMNYGPYLMGVDAKLSVTPGEQAYFKVNIDPGSPVVSNSHNWLISTDGGVTFKKLNDVLTSAKDYSEFYLHLSGEGYQYDSSCELTLLNPTPDMNGWIFRCVYTLDEGILCDESFTLIVHEHTWLPATCTRPETCSFEGCDETRGEALSHKYSEEWSRDASDHWHACTNSECDSKIDESSHTYDGLCGESCTVCGRKRENPHRNLIMRDESGHWMQCAVCNTLTEAKSEHIYNNACDTECNFCGFKREPVHNFRSEWSSDADGHWHECADCGAKKNEAAHIPGAEATEFAPQTCTVCGYVLHEALEHVNHKFTEMKTDAIYLKSEAICTEQAEYYYSCACGEKGTETFRYGDLKDHADTNHDHKCDICGATLSECADHDKDHKCDTCGATLSECADHDKDHKCDICGATLSECADHDKDHKCDTCGAALSECADHDKDHKCDTCGAEITSHSGGIANCAEQAKCSICGEHYGEKDPENHSDLRHFEAKAATKEKEGSIEYWYCSGCGKYYSNADASKEITEAETITKRLSDDDVPLPPQTGNSGKELLWFALMLISGGTVIVLLAEQRKKSCK